MDEVDFYLMDLESKFKKINPSEYYLSYSGGKDSHFLLWFIKEYLRDNQIQIVSVNTYMEHPEIFARMRKHADVILLPKMKPFEVKEKYGSPCFSKAQDTAIYAYQNGNRANWVMKQINQEYSAGFNLNNRARKLLLENKLHRISPLCCQYLKKEPFKEYDHKTGKKPIMGIRGGESSRRALVYKGCFTKGGKFTPLHDLSDELLEKIYKKYNIEVPEIYQQISRTGCAGCPYGSWKGETKKELDLLPDNKRKFVVELFRESYDVLGIDYSFRQTTIDDF